MICPKCVGTKTRVVKTEKGLKNIRLRKCADCGYTWLTQEECLIDNELVEYKRYIDEIDNQGKK